MISRSLSRKVWLKSGGYLIIDQTEALTAIDVNFGRYVGSRSLEDTTLDINLGRSRNRGAIATSQYGWDYCLGLYRYGERRQSRTVYRAMEDILRKDKARTNILKISDLGLMR